ncbi:MAG: hypothetical protein Q4C05_04900 [Akkermansia sp.]|nr:hypothetical protein [Akkermansia sp.]
MKAFSLILLTCTGIFLTSCGCNCNKYPASALKGYKPTSSKSFR